MKRNIINIISGKIFLSFVAAIILLLLGVYLIRNVMSFYGGYEDVDLTYKIDLSGHSEQKQAQNIKDDYLTLGFYARLSPVEDARQYYSLIKYLNQKTGYKFRLRFIKGEGSEIAREVTNGNVHFVVAGAGEYLTVKKTVDVQIIVRGLNSEGKAEYRSVIAVSPKSKISDIKGLKGKRFAFGNPNSTQGHIIPRIALYKNGLTLEDLKSYEYTGSHLKAAKAVSSDKADACGIQDTLGLKLAKKGLLKIIYTSEYYPSSGIFASKKVPTEVINKVRGALVDLQPLGRDAGLLYHWSNTEMPNGFVYAYEKDYDELRRWIKKLGIY